MKTSDIRRSVLIAQQFIRRAESVLEQRKDESNEHRRYYGTSASGAAKRASLELSRQLSRMRNPKW